MSDGIKVFGCENCSSYVTSQFLHLSQMNSLFNKGGALFVGSYGLLFYFHVSFTFQDDFFNKESQSLVFYFNFLTMNLIEGSLPSLLRRLSIYAIGCLR